MNTMPVAYLVTVHIEFDNGRVWQIDIKEQLTDSNPDEIADRLIETMQEYKDTIKKMDFKIDIDKLKKDAEKDKNAPPQKKPGTKAA